MFLFFRRYYKIAAFVAATLTLIQFIKLMPSCGYVPFSPAIAQITELTEPMPVRQKGPRDIKWARTFSIKNLGSEPLIIGGVQFKSISKSNGIDVDGWLQIIDVDNGRNALSLTVDSCNERILGITFKDELSVQLERILKSKEYNCVISFHYLGEVTGHDGIIRCNSEYADIMTNT
ncbi:hypothetical protein [Vibrio paucivorans]